MDYEQRTAPDVMEDVFARMLVAERTKLFGVERMADSERNPPSPDSVEALSFTVERLCASSLARVYHGVPHRILSLDGHELPVELSWNPTGITGGFGGSGPSDRSIASASNLWQSRSRVLLPRPGVQQETEGIYVDADTGLAVVTREVYVTPTLGAYSDVSSHATKPASQGEVVAAVNILAACMAQESVTGPLPVHVEVGYGTDPTAVRGIRTFRDRLYVGIDSAIGKYGSFRESYPNAVRTEATQFTRAAQVERPDEHIVFVIGAGDCLPVGSITVREVIMANVLNADIELGTKQAILQEALRIMDKDGYLVVKVNWHCDEWPPSAMAQLAADNGFIVRSITQHGSHQYDVLERTYGKPQLVEAPDGYYLVAEPY
jgi:hypothetical protein